MMNLSVTSVSRICRSSMDGLNSSESAMNMDFVLCTRLTDVLLFSEHVFTTVHCRCFLPK